MDIWTFIVIAIIAFVGYKFWKNKQESGETENGNAEGGVSAAPQEAEGRLRKTKIDRKWRIVNDWSVLIAGAQGKEETLVKHVIQTLKDLETPNLKVERRKVSLSGMFAESRKQLVVENRRLRGYHVFVSTMDYGKQLSVSWYLMLRENWLTRMLQMATLHPFLGLLAFPLVLVAKIFYGTRGLTIPELMNMFDLEELTAYGTTVHHAVTKATEELMNSLNQDFSKVDTKTRGFLNIS